MRNNILLCGVGGQGIVLTSKLLAAAAMAKNIPNGGRIILPDVPERNGRFADWI